MDKYQPTTCPIFWQSSYGDGKCAKESCKWWRPYANQCAIPLIADILADSTICRNIFEEEGNENGGD